MTATDHALLARLRQGDRTAFDQVYELHAGRLHGFLLRLVRDRAQADDLAQDTWMAFARAAGSLREDSDLAAFLFTIARNQARSHRRWSLLDLLRLALPDEGVEVSDTAGGPEQGLEDARRTERLELALGALDPHHREPLLLVGVEGFSPSRAAVILGLSPVALRKRLSRARRLLADALARQERDVAGRLPEVL